MTRTRPMPRLLLAALLALGLTGCVSLGGGEAPPYLLTLTSKNVVAKDAAQSGSGADALIIRLPTVPKKLNTLRLPVARDGTSIAYLTDAVWVERPNKLFADMLGETITARNGQLVLDPAQSEGLARHYLSGELVNFEVDAASNEVVVTFDAVVQQADKPLRKRRFEQRAPVSLIAPTPVAQALNEAANRVAQDVAEWVK